MLTRPKLRKVLNNRGNSILNGIVATALIGVSAVLISRGYFSGLKFKQLVQQKAGLTSVEDAFVSALTQAAFYLPQPFTTTNPQLTSAQFMNRMLGGSGLDIFGTGTAVMFDNTLASKLDKSNNAKAVREKCNSSSFAPKVPNAASPAEFIFCLSFNNSNNSGKNTFMGSDAAFALVKVTLKGRNGTQRELLTVVPTWQSFVSDPQRTGNYQAHVMYSIYWGSETGEPNVFEKAGFAIKDLR